MTKGSVFISHITDEAPVADALKVYLQRCFGQVLQVFISTDYESISTGEEWYRAVVDGVSTAGAVIVLLSRYSVDRRWINFEAGLALGAGVRVFPLTIRNFQPGEVELPLSQLHLRALVDELALEGVVRAIAEAANLEILQMDDPLNFIAKLNQIEATLPVKSILFEPVLQNQSSGGQVIRFRLSNTGNRDVELIEVEVSVPRNILPDRWVPHQIPNVLSIDEREIEGVMHLIIWEQPYEGPQDMISHGNHRMLPRIVSPHWTPRLSDLLQIPIRTEVDIRPDWRQSWFVKYKVVARGLYVEPGRTRLADIRVRG